MRTPLVLGMDAPLSTATLEPWAVKKSFADRCAVQANALLDQAMTALGLAPVILERP